MATVKSHRSWPLKGVKVTDLSDLRKDVLESWFHNRVYPEHSELHSWLHLIPRTVTTDLRSLPQTSANGLDRDTWATFQRLVTGHDLFVPPRSTIAHVVRGHDHMVYSHWVKPDLVQLSYAKPDDGHCAFSYLHFATIDLRVTDRVRVVLDYRARRDVTAVIRQLFQLKAVRSKEAVRYVDRGVLLHVDWFLLSSRAVHRSVPRLESAWLRDQSDARTRMIALVKRQPIPLLRLFFSSTGWVVCRMMLKLVSFDIHHGVTINCHEWGYGAIHCYEARRFWNHLWVDLQNQWPASESS